MADPEDDFASVARSLAGMAGVMLGWTPDIFWAATPEDLALALAPMRRSDAAHDPAGRDVLARLQEQFPDD